MPAKKDQMRASHILIKRYQQANDILTQVKSGTKFENLAREFSECPSRKKSGDLGFFAKQDMVPEFSKAVLTLQVGELYPEPVKTKFGYHIIKRTG